MGEISAWGRSPSAPLPLEPPVDGSESARGGGMDGCMVMALMHDGERAIIITSDRLQQQQQQQLNTSHDASDV